jgi:hypothetical protein
MLRLRQSEGKVPPLRRNAVAWDQEVEVNDAYLYTQGLRSSGLVPHPLCAIKSIILTVSSNSGPPLQTENTAHLPPH